MGLSFEGIVASGLGEGAFFMSMPHYRKEIKNKLGYEAYPGTLNIKVSTELNFSKLKPMRIEGFKDGVKVFGGASCYSGKIHRIYGAVIVPDFTKHKKDIVEFIAPIHLKTKLKIKDGDTIKVELK